MIHAPYVDESFTIQFIHQYQNEEYALLRMTPTMIEKNNLDANYLLRELLRNTGLLDYGKLGHGRNAGVTLPAYFLQKDGPELLSLSCYLTKNQRGDPRFSIPHLKRRMKDGTIRVGDLLYFSVYRDENNQPQLYFLNLTHKTPSETTILQLIGRDLTMQSLYELQPKLHEILNHGFYDNIKGPGSHAPQDVGATLEALLGIPTNNRTNADYHGRIELKAKRAKGTLDTLFTLRPHFEGTVMESYEHDDRKRVSALTRRYGYDSDAHPGFACLHITIGAKSSPKNNHGFYLDLQESEQKVCLYRQESADKKPEFLAYWTFAELKETLQDKHPATLWFKAEERTVGNQVQFRYTDIEFSRQPQFATFLSLISAGIITYDWRGYTARTGASKSRNHGNAWRIKPRARKELFGSTERIHP